MMQEHLSEDFCQQDDGWWVARCTCGFGSAPLPDSETACDMLMQHAYFMGQKESQAKP